MGGVMDDGLSILRDEEDSDAELLRLLLEEPGDLGGRRPLSLQDSDLNSEGDRQLAQPVESLLRLVRLKQIDEGRSGQGETHHDDAGVGDDELGPQTARDGRRPLSGSHGADRLA